MRRRILIISIFIALLLGIYAGIRLSTPHPPPSPVLAMPDGSELVLAKITTGSNHVMIYENQWQDILYRALPAALRSGLGAHVATVTSRQTNAVVVWLWRRHTPSAATMPYPNDQFVSVVDDSGLESWMHSGPCVIIPTASGDVLQAWEIDYWPPGAKSFKFRAYSYTMQPNWQYQRLGDFTIPISDNAPTNSSWVASALPTTRETNGLEVTLLDAKTGVSAGDVGIGPTYKDARCFTRYSFKFKENGRDSEDWGISSLTPVSFSGQSPAGGGFTTQLRNHRLVMEAYDALWLQEPVWKLEVEVSRSGKYPPEELWSFHDLPIPATNQVAEIHATTNMFGSQIEFLGLSGVGATLPKGWTHSGQFPNLHFITPDGPSSMLIRLVEIRDDRGTLIDTQHSYSSSSGGNVPPGRVSRSIELDIPAESKSLNVTFACTRSRHVEFFVKPALAPPAKPR